MSGQDFDELGDQEDEDEVVSFRRGGAFTGCEVDEALDEDGTDVDDAEAEDG